MSMPAAGWYSDPEDRAGLRWWSGVAWTEHRHVPEPVTNPYAGAAPYVPLAPGQYAYVEPRNMKRSERERVVRRLNPIAYAGIIVSICSFAISFGGLSCIVGVILSSIGLARASRLKRDGQDITGRGYAIAGICAGIAGAVLWASIIVVPIIVRMSSATS